MKTFILLVAVFSVYVCGSEHGIVDEALGKLNEQGHDLKLIKITGGSGGLGVSRYQGEFSKSGGEKMDCEGTYYYSDIAVNGVIRGSFRLQCGEEEYSVKLESPVPFKY